MKISLLEALPLRNTISRRIQDLLSERDSVAFVQFEKGEEYEKPERTVDEVTDELNEVRRDFRKLDVLVYQANLEARITWDNEKISIAEAIELAKQLRGEAGRIKHYANSKKQERNHGYGSDIIIYEKAMFDPAEMQKRVIKLEKMANRLSLDIEKANHIHTIEFEAAEKYM